MGPTSMRCADRQNLRKSEFKKIIRKRLVHLLVDLVDDQDQLPTTGTKGSGKFAVQRSESGATVYNEEKEFGAGDGGLSGHMGSLRKVGIGRISNPSSVDDLEWHLPLAADPRKSVTSNARLVMDDGHTTAHDPVEEGGFTHIRATDDGDTSHEFFVRIGSGTGTSGKGIGNSMPPRLQLTDSLCYVTKTAD